MSVEYQQMSRGSLRPSSGGSRLPTLLIAALAIACMFFAYNHYVTADERDVYRADLAHEVRKATQLEMDKRELMTKNEGLEQDLKQAETIKSEQALKVTSLGEELSAANKIVEEKTAELETVNGKLAEAENKLSAAENNLSLAEKNVNDADQEKSKKLKILEEQVNQLSLDKVAIENKLNECLTQAGSKNTTVPETETSATDPPPMAALVDMARNNAENLQRGDSSATTLAGQQAEGVGSKPEESFLRDPRAHEETPETEEKSLKAPEETPEASETGYVGSSANGLLESQPQTLGKPEESSELGERDDGKEAENEKSPEAAVAQQPPPAIDENPVEDPVNQVDEELDGTEKN